MMLNGMQQDGRNSSSLLNLGGAVASLRQSPNVAKELEFCRQQQSKSQCKERMQQYMMGDNKSNSTMKKSFSSVLLKANNVNGLQNLESEYKTHLRARQQIIKSPFGMNNHSQQHQQFYTSAPIGDGGSPTNGLALVKQISQSSNGNNSSSCCSLGEVSACSEKQQAVKNNYHYGALKHLANAASKPGEQQITRNPSMSHKKLNTLDENVCVNQIRETGLVNQKFDKESTKIYSRLSARKNGSVCHQPANVKTKPLFFAEMGKRDAIQTSSLVESRQSSVENQDKLMEIFYNRQLKESHPVTNLRMAVSQANSPQLTPKIQHHYTKSLQLKSPFLSKQSRKHLSLKDKVPRPKKAKGVNNQIQSDSKIKHNRYDLPASDSKASLKQYALPAPLKSPLKFQSAIQTANSRMLSINVSQALPTSTLASPIQHASNIDQTQKVKRHKFSKSREFYGSGIVTQMKLNSSITSKASQLKQDNVFSAKRKSHGLTIQSSDMGQAALKRRSSGSNILISARHDQTSQPADKKRLWKVSASPPKRSKLPYTEGYDNDVDIDKELLVESIVDTLADQNLIDTKSDKNSKPKVNEILQTLLKAHLKKVDGQQSPVKLESRVASALSRSSSRVQQQIMHAQIVDEQETQQEQINFYSKPEASNSDSSAVYFGVGPTHEVTQNNSSISVKVLSECQPNSVTKKPRNSKKCRRTPATKYPQKHKSTSASKDDQQSPYEYQQQQLSTNQGEMTSPDELYYVNTKVNSAAPMTSQPQNIDPKQNFYSQKYCITPSSPELSSQAYPQTQSREKTSSESPSGSVKSKVLLANNTITTRVQSQEKNNNNSQQSYESGSSSKDKMISNNQYYTSIGKPSTSSLDRRVDGQDTYYANRLTKQQIICNVQQDLQKESTRFSSNERSMQTKEAQRNLSNGSRLHSSKKGNAILTRDVMTPEIRQSLSNYQSSLERNISQNIKSHRPDSNGSDIKSPDTHGDYRNSKKSTSRKNSGSQADLKRSQKSQLSETDSETDFRTSLMQSIKHYYLNKQSQSSHFQSSLDFYSVQKIVGKGAFGKVALATQILTQKAVAIKIIDKTNLQPGQIEKVRCEVSLMSAIRHKHIIRLFEVFESKQHMYMVFEYASGGDLLQLVKRKRALTEKQARSIFRQVVFGIAHCHCRSVLHRDIKLDNILLDGNGDVKVCDFGISRTLEDLNEPILEQCGTPAYIAPEILYEDGYKGFSSDIWGLGVLLFTMVTGTVPFRAQNMRELKHVISLGQFKFPLENPRDGSKLSDGVKDLMLGMLTVDTNERISIPEILAHPWLGSIQDGAGNQVINQVLDYQQLKQIEALQPFGQIGSGSDESLGQSRVSQVRVQNLFIGHETKTDKGPNDGRSSRGLTLTQSDIDEIMIDHATVFINEKAVQMCKTFGFPQKLVRQQVQSNVLNHATACYHSLVL